MEVKKLYDAILRKFWLIVLLAVIGAGIAWYVNEFLTVPIYQAEATMYSIHRTKGSSEEDGLNYQDIMVSRQLVQDFSEIINSQKVTSAAAKELNDVNISQEMLRDMVSIELKKDSSVMGIQAVSSDPKLAAAVANAVSKAFASQIRELTNSDVLILDEAKLPQYSLPANKTKNIAVGVISGMILAFLLTYIMAIFDTTIRNVEDLEYSLKLPVIGIIPEHSIR